MNQRTDKRAPLRHYFYIPRPRSHINLYIEHNFNYKKGAQRRTDVVPPLTVNYTELFADCAFLCEVKVSCVSDVTELLSVYHFTDIYQDLFNLFAVNQVVDTTKRGFRIA